MNKRRISLSLRAFILLVLMSGVSEAGESDFFDFGELSGYGHAAKIIINARSRRLTYISASGKRVTYPIAVPKRGKEWSGTTYVMGKYIRPDWSPPADVAADHPRLPSLIPGGSPRNPMGARAITLGVGNVAIHGTTAKMRGSIGTAASYGCIRMRNEDVIDLYNRVEVGTPVEMIN